MKIEERLTQALHERAAEAPSVRSVPISPQRRRGGWQVLLAAAATVAAVAVPVGLIATQQGGDPTSSGTTVASADSSGTPTSASPIVVKDPDSKWFDGWVYGWRIAPYPVLKAEGDSGSGLPASCRYGNPLPGFPNSDLQTSLDFTPTYLPPGVPDPGSQDYKTIVRGPEKSLCKDGTVLRVYYGYGPLDGGVPDASSSWLAATRFIWGTESFDLKVPADAVRTGDIAGQPAIFVGPYDSGDGATTAEIIVLGADGPYYTLTRVTGINLSWDEVLKTAQGLYADTDP
jgi:hypothetical protein